MKDPIIEAEEKLIEQEGREMTFEEFEEAFCNIFYNF